MIRILGSHTSFLGMHVFLGYFMLRPKFSAAKLLHSLLFMLARVRGTE